MSKEYNRFQDNKALQKAQSIVRKWMQYDPNTPEDKINKIANGIRHNRKKCSCEMCRNPRHSKYNKGAGRLTIQEIKINQKDKDETNTD